MFGRARSKKKAEKEKEEALLRAQLVEHATRNGWRTEEGDTLDGENLPFSITSGGEALQQQMNLRFGIRVPTAANPQAYPAFVRLLETAPRVIEAVNIYPKSDTSEARSSEQQASPPKVNSGSGSKQSQDEAIPDEWNSDTIVAAKPYIIAQGYGWDDEADFTKTAEMARLAKFMELKKFWLEHIEAEEGFNSQKVLVQPTDPLNWMSEEEVRELKAKLPPGVSLDQALADDARNPANKTKDKDPLLGEEGKPMTNLPPPRTFEQSRTHPNSVKPIGGTTFAPPYCSALLRIRPELAQGLHHLNCSFFTAKTRPRNAGGAGRTFEGYGINAEAPTLEELKQHCQSLMFLLKEIGISTAAAEIQADVRKKKIIADGTYGDEEPPNFVDDPGVFDFVQDLDHEYHSKETYEKIPLTHLLNTVEWRDNQSDKVVDVCPLIRLSAEAIARGHHPMPFSRVEALMAHADSALLMIDDALGPSGGLLSALPMNLPEDDPRRKTFLGQMIHFMRVMVSKVATLDKAYGSALDALLGEATIPKHVALNVLTPAEMRTAFSEVQQEYILTNTGHETYSRIWYEMQKKGAPQCENSGLGHYDVYIPTRYRGLVGGKTVFITPDPARMGDGLPGEEHNKERPLVIAVRAPGPATDTSEWLRQHTAELEQATAWRERAEQAEERVRVLEKDVAYLTPDVVLEEFPGRKVRMTATEAWARVTRKEEEVRAMLTDRSVFAKRNRNLQHQNRVLEQENDQLKRWKDYSILGASVDEKLAKENIKLGNLLKAAVEDWNSATGELATLKEEWQDKKDDAAFELRQLREVHRARINQLENQLIKLDKARDENDGADEVNKEMLLQNTRLQQQLHDAIELLKGKSETLQGMEKRLKEQHDAVGENRSLQAKYDKLSEEFEDMKKDWAEQYGKFGKAEPNKVHKAERDVEKAKAALEKEKEENKKLLGKINGLEAKFRNLQRKWEDQAKKHGDKDSEKMFKGLRAWYDGEIDSQLKDNKKLKEEIETLNKACRAEKADLKATAASATSLWKDGENQRREMRAKLEKAEHEVKALKQKEMQLTDRVNKEIEDRLTAIDMAKKFTRDLAESHRSNTYGFVETYERLLSQHACSMIWLVRQGLLNDEAELKTWTEMTEALVVEEEFFKQRLDMEGFAEEQKKWLKELVGEFMGERDKFVDGNKVETRDGRIVALERDVREAREEAEKRVKEKEEEIKKTEEKIKNVEAELDTARGDIEQTVGEKDETVEKLTKELERLKKGKGKNSDLEAMRKRNKRFEEYIRRLGPITEVFFMRMAENKKVEQGDNWLAGKPTALISDGLLKKKGKEAERLVKRFRELHESAIREWLESGGGGDGDPMDVDVGDDTKPVSMDEMRFYVDGSENMTDEEVRDQYPIWKAQQRSMFQK